MSGVRDHSFKFPTIRIAFVSHVFWPEKRRGGERLIRDLSDALIARGHAPRLVTSHRGLPSRADEGGLDVVRQWRPPERPLGALGFPAGTSQVPGAWWALRRGDDDVVQAWTAPAALAAAWSGEPSVYVFQGVLHEDDFAGRPRVRAMLMRAARGCDAVVTYSEIAAEAFGALTGVEARAVEPGIRLDAFTPGAIGDARGASGDARSASGDARSASGDARSASGDARGASGDARGATADAPGGERSAAPAIFCAADPAEPRKRVQLLVDAFAF